LVKNPYSVHSSTEILKKTFIHNKKNPKMSSIDSSNTTITKHVATLLDDLITWRTIGNKQPDIRETTNIQPHGGAWMPADRSFDRILFWLLSNKIDSFIKNLNFILGVQLKIILSNYLNIQYHVIFYTMHFKFNLVLQQMFYQMYLLLNYLIDNKFFSCLSHILVSIVGF
jgi:hypothetical protein